MGAIRERVGLKDGIGKVRVEVTARDVTVREGERTFRGSARVGIHATDVDFRRGEASLAGTQVVLSDVAVGDAPVPSLGRDVLRTGGAAFLR